MSEPDTLFQIVSTVLFQIVSTVLFQIVSTVLFQIVSTVLFQIVSTVLNGHRPPFRRAMNTAFLKLDLLSMQTYILQRFFEFFSEFSLDSWVLSSDTCFRALKCMNIYMNISDLQVISNTLAMISQSIY